MNITKDKLGEMIIAAYIEGMEDAKNTIKESIDLVLHKEDLEAIKTKMEVNYKKILNDIKKSK